MHSWSEREGMNAFSTHSELQAWGWCHQSGLGFLTSVNISNEDDPYRHAIGQPGLDNPSMKLSSQLGLDCVKLAIKTSPEICLLSPHPCHLHGPSAYPPLLSITSFLFTDNHTFPFKNSFLLIKKIVHVHCGNFR